MNKPNFLKLAINAGAARSQEERRATEILASAKDSMVDIRTILPRPHAPSRQLSSRHVLELAASISELGLIEPVAVDRSMRLLAGAHRLAALQILTCPPIERRKVWSELFLDSLPEPDFELVEHVGVLSATIPVHVLDLDCVGDPATALLVEIAENEKRRNYSYEEVRGIASRLQDAGYRFSPGRPKTGEQALIPVLAATIGVSSRTIKRALAPQSRREATDTVPVATVSTKHEDRRLCAALDRWLTLFPERRPARNLVTELLTALGGSRDVARPKTDEVHNAHNLIQGPCKVVVDGRA